MAKHDRTNFDATMSELANASQTTALLATRLRQTLGAVNDDAVMLEGAVVRALRQAPAGGTTKKLFTVVLLLVAAPAFGQPKVYTEADLGKPQLTPTEAAAILAPHQYVAPPTCTRCDGPYFASTGSKGATSGPWDWPEPMPARRLDGTLLMDPPAVYGAYPSYLCPFTYPVPRIVSQSGGIVAHRVRQDGRR